MPDQPALGHRLLNTCPVFVGTATGAQEWLVDQFDRYPLIPVGFGRVGQLEELARSLVGIGEGSISGEFHGLSALVGMPLRFNALIMPMRVHHEVAAFRGADQATDRSLPLVELLLGLRQACDVVGGSVQSHEFVPMR